MAVLEIQGPTQGACPTTFLPHASSHAALLSFGFLLCLAVHPCLNTHAVNSRCLPGGAP